MLKFVRVAIPDNVMPAASRASLNLVPISLMVHTLTQSGDRWIRLRNLTHDAEPAVQVDLGLPDALKIADSRQNP